MQASLYSPQIPGVTLKPFAEDPKVPSLHKALDEPDESIQYQKLAKIAAEAFEAARWYYRESVECIANYYGAQWGYYSETEGRYVASPQPRESDEVRLVSNAIKPITDQATGIITQDDPIFEALSATTEGSDAASQPAASDLCRYIWDYHKLHRMYRLGARESFATGTCAIHVCWDETQGGLIQDGFLVTKEPEFDAEGKVTADPETAPDIKPSGDLRFTYLSRDQVAFDPRARNNNDGEYVIVREVLGNERLKELHPDAFDEMVEEAADGSQYVDQDREARANRVSPLDDVQVGERSQDMEQGTRYTMYVRKSGLHPRGRMVMFGGGKVVYSGDNPVYPTEDAPDRLWPNYNWPVFFGLCDEREGSPWGRGRVVDMIEPQRAFNGTVSKSLQHIAKIANAKVFMPKSLDADWTDEMGQVFRLARTLGPGQIGYIQPPNMPPEYFQMWDRLKTEMQYIAGIQSSTMGNTQTNVESGRHAQMLMQRDYGRLDPVKKDYDLVWGSIILYALRLFQRHAEFERKVLITGENHTYSVKALDRSSLSGELDIRVRNDQSIPRTPAERATWLATFTQTLSQAQDPQMRAMLLELYRLKDFEPFLERMNPDQVKARRMAHNVMQGVPTKVFEGDDPLVFKLELERLAKSEEYEIKVERESGEGESPTEFLMKTYWTYYTRLASGPQPGAEAQQAPGGPPPQAAPAGPTEPAETQAAPIQPMAMQPA